MRHGVKTLTKLSMYVSVVKCTIAMDTTVVFKDDDALIIFNTSKLIQTALACMYVCMYVCM